MNWGASRLKYVARLAAGGTPSVSDEVNWVDLDDESGVPWISIGDMSNRPVVGATKRKVSRRGIREARLAVAPPGTLLMSMYASLGHTAVLQESATWNQAILAIIPTSKIDGRFLKYALDSQKNDLPALARSSTQDNLNAEQIGNLPVPLPPLDEQRRIADFLDLETQRCDRLDALRIEQLALLEERVRNTISETMFPGLERQSESHSKWPWLPRSGSFLPLIPLKYCCKLQSGITVHDGRELDGQDIVTRPYLRVANVQAGVVNLGELSEISVPRAMANRSTLRAGDVLMTEGGDLDKLGRGAVWSGEIDDCLHQNHVFAIRPLPSRLLGQYLAFLTQSLHGRCYFESTGKRTTNLASTNSANILNFPIPLPPIEGQSRMVGRLNKAFVAHRNARTALESQRALLEERKRALITAAVMGQMDVTTARGLRR